MRTCKNGKKENKRDEERNECPSSLLPDKISSFSLALPTTKTHNREPVLKRITSRLNSNRPVQSINYSVSQSVSQSPIDSLTRSLMKSVTRSLTRSTKQTTHCIKETNHSRRFFKLLSYAFLSQMPRSFRMHLPEHAYTVVNEHNLGLHRSTDPYRILIEFLFKYSLNLRKSIIKIPERRVGTVRLRTELIERRVCVCMRVLVRRVRDF